MELDMKVVDSIVDVILYVQKNVGNSDSLEMSDFVMDVIEHIEEKLESREFAIKMPTLEEKIVQEFKAFIGSVEFDDKETFYTVSFFLEQLSEKGLFYNEEVVQCLRDDVWNISYKIENFSRAEFEHEIISSIQDDLIFAGDTYYAYKLVRSNLALEKANRGLISHERIVENIEYVYGKDILKGGC